MSDHDTSDAAWLAVLEKAVGQADGEQAKTAAAVRVIEEACRSGQMRPGLRAQVRAYVKAAKVLAMQDFDDLIRSMRRGPEPARRAGPTPAEVAAAAYGPGRESPFPDAPTDFSGDRPPAVHLAYREWFGQSYDTGALDVILCAARGVDLSGTPAWVNNVAGSGCTKTETITPLAAAGARIAGRLSGEAALLSATPDADRAPDATGGLLQEVGNNGLLVIKDLTSVLTLNRDTRAGVLSALREVHDGAWVRDVGAEGGRGIPWAGRLVLIAACTTAWDSHYEVISVMGDRWVIVRQRIDRAEAGGKAISNVGAETRMHRELGSAVRDLLALPVGVPPVVDDATAKGLLELSEFVTRTRTPVERDYHGTPLWAHDLEAPTRFPKELIQLARGGLSLGMSQDAAMVVAVRAASDSVPPRYLAALADLHANPASTVERVKGRTGWPWTSTRRVLEELELLGCVRSSQVGYTVAPGYEGEVHTLVAASRHRRSQ
jgi:hypothetical protein